MQQNDAQYQKMITTPIPKLVLSLAIPTMLGMLVTSAYNVADTYFVSKLGTSASGAVGIVFSLMSVIQAVGFMVGMGAGSAVSRLLGEKENGKVQKIASCALLTSVVFGCFLSILGLASSDTLTVLILSHLVPFLPFFEVIPEIFCIFAILWKHHESFSYLSFSTDVATCRS